jgi:hypothetical protein
MNNSYRILTTVLFALPMILAIIGGGMVLLTLWDLVF